MSKIIVIEENALNIVLEVTDEEETRLVHFSPTPYDPERLDDAKKSVCRLVELHISGGDHGYHGSKHFNTSQGCQLRYVEHKDYCNNTGRKLEVEQKSEEIKVVSHIQFYQSIPIVRCWTEVTNTTDEPLGVEYISSFFLGCICNPSRNWADTCMLHIPHNTWHGEAQWRKDTLRNHGLHPAVGNTLKRLSYSVTGTWSCNDYLPMGMLENTERSTIIFWQIENNGSWQWEIGGAADDIYLALSGPTENENSWWKQLLPVENFISAPVAIGSVQGGVDEAVGALTSYRRVIRRPNEDNEKLAVIFNDYMNCLWGDPTTEKLIPLIDAAAEVGCEYFCIDAGWYADGDWYDNVGEWLPSKTRFPGGIEDPIRRIRQKGMIPGLWLELEVMGISCPLAYTLPDDWFFIRHGGRVIDNRRYQLDYRNPEVRAYADSVLERIINDYGVGYIKMDYNMNAGSGTEIGSDSFGDGLLMHNRAYLDWLDRVFEKYPDLIIENCGSGGLRMNYALLSRHSIQSSSDQTDYRKYSAIAAASPTACTPEQCAVWSYPLKDGDLEETVYNMVNTMLLRIHQSGHLAEISPERKALVKEGIAYYKSIRQEIKTSLPVWPLGLPNMADGWISLGLITGNHMNLAVWRAGTDKESCNLQFEFLRHRPVNVALGYPNNASCSWHWHPDNGSLEVTLPAPYTARIFRLEWV